MPKVPAVSVEMMPLELPIVDCNGAFQLDDAVTLTKDGKPELKGRVCKVQSKVYGVDRQPGLAMSIAITAGNLRDLAGGGFAGYAVRSDGNPRVSGTIRTPCQVKSPARLMDARALSQMLETALDLIDRAAKQRKSDYVLQWFGREAFDKAQMALIHMRCADLLERASGLARIVFQCASSETLGAIDNTDPLRNGPVCRIRLGRGFTYDRYSWGERVCTIIHEMTHWFLNTVDAELADGTPCYGAACLRLAKSGDKQQRLKALNNADNWAYYICQYRSSNDRNDWRFFSEAEIAGRGAFVPGGYNVVESMMAFH